MSISIRKFVSAMGKGATPKLSLLGTLSQLPKCASTAAARHISQQQHPNAFPPQPEVQKKEVHVVLPAYAPQFRSESDLAPFQSVDTNVSLSYANLVMDSIVSEIETTITCVPIAKAVSEAEENGADAVVIDCMGDPGLRPSREICSVPVVAPGEVSMHIASTIGSRFSIISVIPELVSQFETLVKLYNMKDNLASIQALQVMPSELKNENCDIVGLTVEAAAKAVRDNRANVIVLGCTGYLGKAHRIEAGLEEEIGVKVPVIDPLPLAIKYAKMLADCNLSQSKMLYKKPLRDPFTIQTRF